MEDLIKLGNIMKVKVYPYRTSKLYLTDRFFQINRYTDVARTLEEELAKKAGASHPDNHTGYMITMKNGNQLAVFCSDTWLSIGLSLVEEHW